MTARVLVPVVLTAALLGACTSTDDNSIGSVSVSTSAPATTSTTEPLESSTSTTMAPESSTSSSSTIPAVVGLDMSADGLGDALFGADADGVVDYVRAILGAPTADSGWVDPVMVGAACPGTEVRFVEWNDLALFFSDESFFGSGIRHFASYRYGPTMRTNIEPYGLHTTDGFSIGATVAQLRVAYPDATVYPGDQVAEPSIELAPSLVAFLTEASLNGHAISYLGGFGCGE